MTSLRFNLLIIILFMILIFLQYRLWFQAGGLGDMMQLKKNLTLQEKENQQLRNQNQELLTEILRLKHSTETAESKARSELGMIKKGETFYRVLK